MAFSGKALPRRGNAHAIGVIVPTRAAVATLFAEAIEDGIHDAEAIASLRTKADHTAAEIAAIATRHPKASKGTK